MACHSSITSRFSPLSPSPPLTFPRTHLSSPLLRELRYSALFLCLSMNHFHNLGQWAEPSTTMTHRYTGLPFRGSAIPDSEATKNLYMGSVVRVSASYRPSSKVVGCGEGSGEGTEPPPKIKKNIFIHRFTI